MEPKAKKSKIDLKVKHLLAHILSVFGNVLFALGVVLEKVILRPDNLNQINTLRFAVGVLVLLPVAIWYREPFFGVQGERLKVLAWMLAFAISEILIQYSYSMINASEAIAIRMTFPFAVNLISAALLKTKFQKIVILSAVLAGVGIYLIDGPPDTHRKENSTVNWKVLGVCLAFVSTAIYSFCPVVSNMMKKSSVTVPLIAYHAVVMFVSMGNALTQETIIIPKEEYEWALAIMSGASCTLGIFLCYIGYKIGEPRVQAVFGLLEIPSVFLLEIVILGRRPSWVNGGGVVLIMISVALATLQDKIESTVTTLCKRTKVEVKPTVFLISYAYKTDYQEK